MSRVRAGAAGWRGLDLHQRAAIEEPLARTGIVIGVQARNTVMARLLEPLEPPGSAKARVLQDQRVRGQVTRAAQAPGPFPSGSQEPGPPPRGHASQFPGPKAGALAERGSRGGADRTHVRPRKVQSVSGVSHTSRELAVDGDEASAKAESARRRGLTQRLARQAHQQTQRLHAPAVRRR